jgi:hypothetical protein
MCFLALYFMAGGAGLPQTSAAQASRVKWVAFGITVATDQGGGKWFVDTGFGIGVYRETSRNADFIEMRFDEFGGSDLFVRIYNDRMMIKGPLDSEFMKKYDGNWSD